MYCLEFHVQYLLHTPHLWLETGFNLVWVARLFKYELVSFIHDQCKTVAVTVGYKRSPLTLPSYASIIIARLLFLGLHD